MFERYSDKISNRESQMFIIFIITFCNYFRTQKWTQTQAGSFERFIVKGGWRDSEVGAERVQSRDQG